jgi:hypothetical protein
LCRLGKVELKKADISQTSRSAKSAVQLVSRLTPPSGGAH